MSQISKIYVTEIGVPNEVRISGFTSAMQKRCYIIQLDSSFTTYTLYTIFL